MEIALSSGYSDSNVEVQLSGCVVSRDLVDETILNFDQNLRPGRFLHVLNALCGVELLKQRE